MSELVHLAGEASKGQQGEEPEPREEVRSHYPLELLFDAPPQITSNRFDTALRQVGDGGSFSPREPEQDLESDLRQALGAPPRLQIDGVSSDRGAPPSWLFGAPEQVTKGALSDALSQSWWWPDAESVVQTCRFKMRLVDHRMVGLDYKQRLRRLQQICAASIEAFSPAALHWPASEQLLEPASFLRSVQQDDYRSPLPGGFNVRFFRLEFDESAPGADQEFLMDTRGLTALGLVDLQCHFRGLDPEDVSHVLYSTGNYVFDKGRVIAPGNTVQGPGPRDAWLCRSGDSLGPPPREVIDLDPGFPFAAEDYEGGTERD